MKNIIGIAMALVLGAGSLAAQVLNPLHNFGSVPRDGTSPETGLVLDGNTLYGTTVSSSTNGNGSVYKVNIDGTGYATLLSLTNSMVPEGALVLIGNTIYGTMFTGGTADGGSVFKINTDGGGFEEFYSFHDMLPSFPGTNVDGNRPQSGLVTDGTTLYGTTTYGGTNGSGTVFKINANGSGFTVIKTFPPTYLGTNNVSTSPLNISGTNIDGARPVGGLVLDGTTLYGTAFRGGVSNGLVFAMQTDGSGYTVLKTFPGLSSVGTNSDGAAPTATLVLGGDTLYGVTVGGGAGGAGVIFKVKTNGTDFANLHNFQVNDGLFPRNPLFLDGGTLYGTTQTGGTSNKGTIFMMFTNGQNFTVLKNLDTKIGYNCNVPFLLRSNIFYETASSGGSNGGGVIFGFSVLPQILSDGNRGFQSNAFGFDFTGISNQSAVIERCTNLTLPAWLPLQTNTLTGAPQYFSDPQTPQNPAGFYRIRSP